MANTVSGGCKIKDARSNFTPKYDLSKIASVITEESFDDVPCYKRKAEEIEIISSMLDEGGLKMVEEPTED